LTSIGIEISEGMVSRILRKLPRPPGETWKKFLRDDLGRMVSIELCTVLTITGEVPFVFIIGRARHSALSAAGSGRRLWRRYSVAHRFLSYLPGVEDAPRPGPAMPRLPGRSPLVGGLFKSRNST
jgi:hypothetical protein